MEWKTVSSVSNVDAIVSAVGRDRRFHAVIFCGAVDALPLALMDVIVADGCLIAPVVLDRDENRQQFQMVIDGDDGEREIRKITDFGVIFENAK